MQKTIPPDKYVSEVGETAGGVGSEGGEEGGSDDD